MLTRVVKMFLFSNLEFVLRKISAFGFLAIATFLFGLMVGCSDSSTNNNTSGRGQMEIFLIDAPGDYEQVNVEVVEVRIHRAGEDSLSGWYTISQDTTAVNLLELTDGNYAVLADSTLPAGEYSQVRLILSDANTVMVDGELHDLEIPSSSQSGLKLNHPFEISDGLTYSVTLDFDADRSIHQTGNGQYKMRPVICLIVNEFSGSMVGVVEPVEARAMVTTYTATNTVIASADIMTGEFSFGMLPAGSYDLEISATAGAYLDSLVLRVSVGAGLETDIGTIVLQSE